MEQNIDKDLLSQGDRTPRGQASRGTVPAFVSSGEHRAPESGYGLPSALPTRALGEIAIADEREKESPVGNEDYNTNGSATQLGSEKDLPGGSRKAPKFRTPARVAPFTKPVKKGKMLGPASHRAKSLEELPTKETSPAPSSSSRRSGSFMDCTSDEESVEINVDGMEEETTGNELIVDEDVELVSLEKKGRGRRQTTGLYVGRANAKLKLLSIEREAADFQLEKLAAEKIKGAAKILGVRGEGIKLTPMVELKASINESLDAIETVSKKSKGLKGTCVKDLKNAASLIRVAVEEMGLRLYENQDTSSVQNIEMDDNSLGWQRKLNIAEKRIEELTKEVEFLKNRSGLLATETPDRKKATGKSKRKLEVKPDSSDEDLKKVRQTTINTDDRDVKLIENIVGKLNDLLEQKINNLRDEFDRRYLPCDYLPREYSLTGHPMEIEEPMDPTPGISTDPTPGTSIEAAPGPKKEKRNLKPEKKKEKQKPKIISDVRIKDPTAGELREKETKDKFERISKRLQLEHLGVEKGLEDRGVEGRTLSKGKELWSEVTKRRGNKQKEKIGSAEVKAQASNNTKTNPSKRIRRLPKTEAITIICPEGSYEKIMDEATSKLNLSDLGITEGVKQRTTRTGALSIQIAGEGKKEKADKLSECLKITLANKEGVKISRPVIKSEILITGLNHSITTDQIVAAIAKEGDCHKEDVKVNPTKINPRTRRGTAWARCPANVANKIITSGGLKIRWTKVGVILLEQKALQCYRCLAPGHVSNECKSQVDRSGICYKCGEKDHIVKDCTGALNCPACADRGMPTDHRVGSKKCSLAEDNTKRSKAKREQSKERNKTINKDNKGIKTKPVAKKGAAEPVTPDMNRFSVLERDDVMASQGAGQEETPDWPKDGMAWSKEDDLSAEKAATNTPITPITPQVEASSQEAEQMEVTNIKMARPASSDEEQPKLKRGRIVTEEASKQENPNGH